MALRTANSAVVVAAVAVAVVAATAVPMAELVARRKLVASNAAPAVKKADITPDLVARLVASQFPEWAELPVSRVALDGWDNTTFRLGETMSARLPSGDSYVAQIDKEHRWLPVLREQLPFPIPQPLAKGAPGSGFPRPWSIYRWLDGETANAETVSDLGLLASDLATFLNALYDCDVSDGPAAGRHSFSRGGPVTVWDAPVRELLGRLQGRVDIDGASEVWSAATDAHAEGHPVWVHGDVTGSNLLVRDGRLSAVIDFGCSAVGDPACDTTIAWTVFRGESRALFKSQLHVDGPTWARGRGWALWKALLELGTDLSDPGHAERAAIRVGWRQSAAQIVDDLVADHRGESV
jgi:aminoglycoside phosphotransferase (APT) family kinase protein